MTSIIIIDIAITAAYKGVSTQRRNEMTTQKHVPIGIRVRTNVGCYNLLSPREESLMIQITDPLFNDGKPFSFHLDSSEYSYSDDVEWSSWMLEAVEERIKRMWICSDRKLIESFRDSWLSDDYMGYRYELGFYEQFLKFSEPRLEVLINNIEKARKRINSIPQYISEIEQERAKGE